MMKNRLVAAAAAMTVAVSAASPAAATVLDYTNQQSASYTIAAFAPIGQSFVAVDPTLTSIGFRYDVLNPDAVEAPLTIDLYAGAGFGGTIVASRTFSLSKLIGIYDTDFGGIALTVGQTYTAALSTSSWAQAVSGSWADDQYTGGKMYLTGSGVDAVDGADLAFRVTGAPAAALPEPSTWALMVLGFGLIGGSIRRRATVHLNKHAA